MTLSLLIATTHSLVKIDSLAKFFSGFVDLPAGKWRKLTIPGIPTRQLPEAAVLSRFLEVEHPIRAKLVGKHAEAGAPEGVLQGHRDFAVLSECAEESFDFVETFAVEAYREVVSGAERRTMSGQGVGCHKNRRSVFRDTCV